MSSSASLNSSLFNHRLLPTTALSWENAQRDAVHLLENLLATFTESSSSAAPKRLINDIKLIELGMPELHDDRALSTAASVSNLIARVRKERNPHVKDVWERIPSDVFYNYISPFLRTKDLCSLAGTGSNNALALLAKNTMDVEWEQLHDSDFFKPILDHSKFRGKSCSLGRLHQWILKTNRFIQFANWISSDPALKFLPRSSRGRLAGDERLILEAFDQFDSTTLYTLCRTATSITWPLRIRAMRLADRFKYQPNANTLFLDLFRDSPAVFQRLINDEQIVHLAIQSRGLDLEHVNARFQDNESFVELAVQQNGLALAFASQRLQDNERIVLLAIQQNGLALEFASRRLQDSEEIVFLAVEQNTGAFKHAGQAFQENRSLVLLFIQRNPTGLLYAPTFFQYDKEIVHFAVQNHPKAILYASPSLQEDPDILQLAVRQDGLLLAYAPQSLQDDEITVHLAINQNPDALRFASDRLRNDKKTVSLAIQRNGTALRFAGPRAQNDKELVIAAVQQFGGALEFANPHLQDDDFVVRLAVEQVGWALNYASMRLRKDPLIMKLAAQKLSVQNSTTQTAPIMRNISHSTAISHRQPPRCLHLAVQGGLWSLKIDEFLTLMRRDDI